MIPKPDEDDPYKNRRIMAYAMLVYALVFILLVWGLDVFTELSAASVAAYLGIVSVITGFVLKMYFEAVK
jgi:hypothetical protein